ncbi:hypothetical protein BJ980_002439 [Nocardioides daedukensis]|uniref:DUF5926 domain-containing protein n=1 Tax=Nocardioides daedukensis TaxID=634462 RepID=A0A7Y9URB8_9ACTN|nr:DUF5926 family protein [Nocardioides daedukensis]NYG59516.1 hypothetical protein [Nocardioides daedukensis]
MGKSSRKKNRAAEAPAVDGAVGPRQPCPCGSGRRYKACHGAADGPPPAFVARPFEGYASETDLVALRELVPAATAPLKLKDSDREVRLCTLLPGAAPAMVREGGAIWLGLQVQHAYGDPARDLGAVLTKAVEHAEAGETGIVGLTEAPGEGPRFTDLVEDEALEVTVHEGFGYWLDDVEDRTPEMDAALDQANGSVHPTVKLKGVEAAYWTNVGSKEHLRWAMPEDEDALLNALTRLHTKGADTLVEGGRLVGMFRAHGVLVPVWDLPVGTGAEVLEEPAKKFAAELADALADDSELTSAERSAKSSLAGRQVTIR